MTEDHNSLPVIPDDSEMNEHLEQERAHHDKIYGIIDAAWGSNVGDQGFANPYEVAARTYDALNDPEHFMENMDARKRAANPGIPDDKLPSANMREKTANLLTAPREDAEAEAPDRDQFIGVMAEAVLHKADVGSMVLSGGREQIVGLIAQGDRPAIWSAGHDEHQHRKLGKTGLFDSVAIADISPPVEVVEELGEPIEVPTVIAANKMSEDSFDRVRAIAGEDQAIVVDDRIGNVQAFMDNIEGSVGIWLQYGAHAEKRLKELREGKNPDLQAALDEGKIVVITNINQLTSTIAELRISGRITKEQAAVFFDYDDTLSNNAERRKLELEAATEALIASDLA